MNYDKTAGLSPKEQRFSEKCKGLVTDVMACRMRAGRLCRQEVILPEHGEGEEENVKLEDYNQHDNGNSRFVLI